MDRRSFLVTAAVLFTSCTAGCFSEESSEPQCHFMHEIVESPEDYGHVSETYRYEELSSDAQKAFKNAITDGSYSTTNRSFEAAEFRYWDTTTVYNITYQNETYVLLTYSGGGCKNR